MMTGPTRLLSAMILNIRLGNFVPDATRRAGPTGSDPDWC